MVTLTGLIEYTDAELEQKAHEYIRHRVDVQFGIPVNVELLLEGHENVEVDYVDGLGKYGGGFAGCVCRHMNGVDLKVFIDQDLADSGAKPLYLATVAEELAHIILHKSVFIQVKSFPEFLEVQRSPEWGPIERDAKRLSAAMRMPFRNLALNVEQMYPDIVDEHGFGDITEVQKLLRNALAQKFLVPPQDMHRRLMQWPCRAYERVAMSVQGKLNRLASIDAEVRVREPKRQQLTLPYQR